MNAKRKHVLVAPLDWGLGHATRCVPIIRLLLKRGCQVSIATSGQAKRLLSTEFPELKIYDLPSYGATYSKYIPLMLHVFFQLPKFLFAISQEKKRVEKIVQENGVEVIISDNRYGCRVSKIQSVFICHQINLIMPRWFLWLSPVINNFNHRWILKFDQCWIPDDPNNSLSGKLSRPSLPNAVPIGTLSRFTKTGKHASVYGLAVILSGPEPQRTVFENIVLSQLNQVEFKIIIVRGLLDGTDEIKTEGNVSVVNHLSSNSLQQVIEEAEIVLCRSGYSSLMDLATLQRKVILVPTLGQTEQEYLGERLMKKKIALCRPQKNFDLQKALVEIKDYPGFVDWPGQFNLVDQAINKVLL